MKAKVKKDMSVKSGDQSKAPEHKKEKKSQGKDFVSAKALDGMQSMAPDHKPASAEKAMRGQQEFCDAPEAMELKEPGKEMMEQKGKAVPTK